jgi:hypothetical protein
MITLLGFSGCERIKDRIEEVYTKKQAGGAAAEAAPPPVYAVNTTLAVQGPIQDYLA